MNQHLPQKSQFLVYQAENGQMKIDVRLENETVWLTQRLMAELFQKDVRTINHHILSVYEEGELDREATIRKYGIVQKEGAREVAREVDYYNLDMIISVGYRVKSAVATRFRSMNLNERDILTHAGSISHEMARELAEGEYDKFHARRIAESKAVLSDFDKTVKRLTPGKKGIKK